MRKDENFTFELYDLKTDTTESVDIAAKHPEIIEKVKAIIKREHTKSYNTRWQFKVLGDE